MKLPFDEAIGITCLEKIKQGTYYECVPNRKAMKIVSEARKGEEISFDEGVDARTVKFKGNCVISHFTIRPVNQYILHSTTFDDHVMKCEKGINNDLECKCEPI